MRVWYTRISPCAIHAYVPHVLTTASFVLSISVHSGVRHRTPDHSNRPRISKHKEAHLIVTSPRIFAYSSTCFAMQMRVRVMAGVVLFAGLCSTVCCLPCTPCIVDRRSKHCASIVLQSHPPFSAHPVGLQACRGGGDAARLGRADVSDQLLRVVQTLGGVAIIFAVERSVWALGIYMGRSIPSAPVGMMLVFFALVAADVLAPHLTAKVSPQNATQNL